MDRALQTQTVFLAEAKRLWNQWTAGIISTVHYKEQIDFLVWDASRHLDNEDPLLNSENWKYASDDAAEAMEAADVQAEGRMKGPRRRKTPGASEQHYMKTLIKYAWKVAAKLEMLTEDAAEATQSGQRFGRSANGLFRAFIRGLVDIELCIEAIDLLLKASSPAAGGVQISEEARKECSIAIERSGPIVYGVVPEPLETD